MMWFFLLLYTVHLELVIVQGDDRLILKNGSNPCEGYIVIYRNEELGFVGDQLWSTDIEKVVCRSTHCGKPVGSSRETFLWPIDKVWLNKLNCTGSETHLWDCGHPGWVESYFNKGHLRKIACSNEIKIRLHGSKSDCAGAVQYSTDDGKTYSGYFCAEGFGIPEADRLCKDLNCGQFKEIPTLPWGAEIKFKDSKKMKARCSGIKDADNLWQCATEESQTCQNPASVVCTGHKRLQLRGDPSNVCSGKLEEEEGKDKWTPVKTSEMDPDVWCQQMHCGTSHSANNSSGIYLTCKDKVEVVLKDKNEPSDCYGAVHIKVNNTESRAVCGSSWTKTDAEVVCRELNCGLLIDTESKPSENQGIMDYVDCKGKESSLWHCRAKRDKSLFKCRGTAYVVCADSMNVTLKDGPGRCAGRVEVRSEGQWKRVSQETWTKLNSDVVCKQLNCGESREPLNPEKFSQGSADFLAKNVDCKKKSKHISECIKGKANNQRREEKAVGITCEEHKVVFLKGDTACSGMVGIEQGQKTHWLSGSNKTWTNETANTVCRQMNCGEASHHYITPSGGMIKDVLQESYNCSSNATSLFECEKGKLPADYNNSVAHVECSGKISVSLTKDCWGTVNICMGGECGGVCADTWTPPKSMMLCQNLGCGNAAQVFISKANRGNVIFKSLHTTKQTTNLTQCNFVRNDENGNNCEAAYVVCSGSFKSRFQPSRDKCSGNVEVYYEDKWLPVCKDALEEIETRNTICRDLKCGEAGDPIDYFGPKPAGSHVISKIQCPANGNESLTACNMTLKKDSCTGGGLQCSSWSKMKLTGTDMSCKGAVSVLSKGKTSPVPFAGWTQTEGNRLCQDLECGEFKSNSTVPLFSPWTTDFSCADVENPENIWACEKQTSHSQKKRIEQLFIECQDEPDITLSKKCHGEVKINSIEVCDTHWDANYSKLVCQQKICGNAITGIASVTNPERDNKKYYHVKCEDNHYDLGQCKRFQEKCDGKLVSVYCVDNIEFNTTEKCGGQIQVNYRDQWEKVCPPDPFLPEYKTMLCNKLGCGGHNGRTVKSNYSERVNLDTTLSCTSNIQEIKHCVRHSVKSCESVKPAEIYCTEYVPKQIAPPPLPPPPIVPILLGVGLFLLLVIVIVVFIRVCVVRRARNAMSVSSRMLSRKEEEFESGDYEDVTSKGNEMEDFSHGKGLRAQSEVITENDQRSTSSFPYDDIDDMEAQPLTSQSDAANDSGDNYINQSAAVDGVIDEVDDPQENYDDIAANPEITQTEAEIHQSPQTAPEGDAVPSSVLVQGDDDYLVPGQDG